MHSARIIVVHLCLVFLSVTVNAQVSLSGAIKDRADGTSIVGADVVIASTTKGISGPDGKYLVKDLSGAELLVTYRKEGYGTEHHTVHVTGRAIEHNVVMLKDTADLDYWNKVLTDVSARANSAAAGGRSKVYEQAWQDVDASGISAEAKAVAGRQFAASMPPDIHKPATLEAYSKVDSESLRHSQDAIKKAVENGEQLTNTTTAVPSTVVADVAAKQVNEYEQASKKPIPKNFFTNFEQVFGASAAARLQTNVSHERQSRGVF